MYAGFFRSRRDDVTQRQIVVVRDRGSQTIKYFKLINKIFHDISIFFVHTINKYKLV